MVSGVQQTAASGWRAARKQQLLLRGISLLSGISRSPVMSLPPETEMSLPPEMEMSLPPEMEMSLPLGMPSPLRQNAPAASLFVGDLIRQQGHCE
jgi:hypothetical protein